MMRLASTVAAVTAVGVVAALSLLAGIQSVPAADNAPGPLIRLAAVSPDPSVHPWQALSTRGGDPWLIAQGGGPTVSRAAWNENTVVAHFEISAPEGAERDIATAYDLELIEQSTLVSLNLRIARYRAPDAKSVASLLERLRHDYRVAEVQDGEQYVRPAPPAPDIGVSLADEPKGSPPGGPPTDNTIVANFQMSAPDGAEEDVARAHGLELVDKSKLFSLGMRIARYRVIGPQALTPLLERLRQDYRVAEVQEAVRYARPVPEAPDIEVGAVTGPEQGPPQAVKADRGPPPRQPDAARKVQPKKAPAVYSKLATASPRQPLRGVNVADVLAGGL